MKLLLTGNEAVALGIMDAGAAFASAYPGTPSTEITEELAKHKDRIYAEWAPNEKAALEGAIGASYAGARAAACMKQVGLNVAADPFFTCAATGVNAGLVLICADEPGIHSSQNEQDNRWYALHANIPMLEPSDSQECYDMVRSAYEISEKYATIVLVRMTTRVCHSKSVVTPTEPEPKKIAAINNDPVRFVPVPANARIHKAGVLDRAGKLALASSESAFNHARYASKKIGVIASGVCYEYAREVFGEDASYFKVGFSHPLPYARIKSFARTVEKLYVIEEHDPYMETLLAAAGVAATGKALFPSQGELTPDVIRKCVFGGTLPVIDYDKSIIPNRAPVLCAGCPHRGIFYILGKQKNIYLSGDIGCYTLGFAPPFNAIHTVTCMGASISAAHGAQKVFSQTESSMRAVAVIGDSTFFHTGVNSLMNVAYNKSDTITVILDNRITGMTGHQENPGSGKTAQMEDTQTLDIARLCRALGVENVRTFDPNDLKAARDALDWALSLKEASVIIARFPCALKTLTNEDRAEFNDPFKKTYAVDAEKCTGCKICLKAGCPSVSIAQNGKAVIDENTCLGCTVCAQICPAGAISPDKEESV